MIPRRSLGSQPRLVFGFALSLLVTAALAPTAALGDQRWVIHEWGTFTALQDETGRALGGINVDDEPLPPFVHNLNPYVLDRSYSLGYPQMKGVPERHPFVTLRLETPVIYFHPPRGAAARKLDVKVALHGGWLTQFYPAAKADAPGLKDGDFEFGPITAGTIGRLEWRDLTVGPPAPGPKTESGVWLSPRHVDAADLTTAEGESERYLFYRGVGNVGAPLQVVADPGHDQFAIHAQFADVLRPRQSEQIGRLWLVHVRPDGQVAYRPFGPLPVTGDPGRAIGRVRASFDQGDFSYGRLDELRHELHGALVADGLLADEAQALIETWNRAYFRSPGLRLFFLVPRTWTDHYLPLSVSVAADIRRVMVGRIELISPEQQDLLKKLSVAKPSDPSWVYQVRELADGRKVVAASDGIAEPGVRIPSDYQMYLDLGRFRNALVLEQQRRHATPQLATFISNYNLQAFPVSAAETNKP